jgi:hypothetical protein
MTMTDARLQRAADALFHESSGGNYYYRPEGTTSFLAASSQSSMINWRFCMSQSSLESAFNVSRL